MHESGAAGAARAAWCETFTWSSVLMHCRAGPIFIAETESRSDGCWKTNAPISPHPAESETAAVFLGIFMGT